MAAPWIYKSKISWYFMGRQPILNWRREILSSTWSQTHPLSTCPTLTSAQIFAPNLRIPDLRPHTLQQMPLMPLSRGFLWISSHEMLAMSSSLQKNMVYDGVCSGNIHISWDIEVQPTQSTWLVWLLSSIIISPIFPTWNTLSLWSQMLFHPRTSHCFWVAFNFLGRDYVLLLYKDVYVYATCTWT